MSENCYPGAYKESVTNCIVDAICWPSGQAVDFNDPHVWHEFADNGTLTRTVWHAVGLMIDNQLRWTDKTGQQRARI